MFAKQIVRQMSDTDRDRSLPPLQIKDNQMKDKRDGNVLKNYRREINLQTKQVKDKSKYRRKEKHKKPLN